MAFDARQLGSRLDVPFFLFSSAHAGSTPRTLQTASESPLRVTSHGRRCRSTSWPTYMPPSLCVDHTMVRNRSSAPAIMPALPVQRQRRMHVQIHMAGGAHVEVDNGCGGRPAEPATSPPELSRSVHVGLAEECPQQLGRKLRGARRAAGGAQVAMRNSRYPDGPVLIYSHDEIVAFIESARDGDFDHLVA